MNSTFRRSAFLFLLGTLLTNTANAQIIFDNGAGGAAGLNDAFSSDLDVSILGADDFSFSNSAVVTGIEWSGLYAFFGTEPAVEDFTIDIYDDVGGLPGTVLSSTNVGNAVNRIDSGVDIPGFGFDIFDYSASITPFNATAGTTYWLNVYGNTVGEDDDWLWGIVNGAGNSSGSISNGTSWNSEGHLMDFRLSGSSVPEPNSALAIGLVLGMIATRRRQRS